jgi:hypothetical protein
MGFLLWVGNADIIGIMTPRHSHKLIGEKGVAIT